MFLALNGGRNSRPPSSSGVDHRQAYASEQTLSRYAVEARVRVTPTHRRLGGNGLCLPCCSDGQTSYPGVIQQLDDCRIAFLVQHLAGPPRHRGVGFNPQTVHPPIHEIERGANQYCVGQGSVVPPCLIDSRDIGLIDLVRQEGQFAHIAEDRLQPLSDVRFREIQPELLDQLPVMPMPGRASVCENSQKAQRSVKGEGVRIRC